MYANFGKNLQKNSIVSVFMHLFVMSLVASSCCKKYILSAAIFISQALICVSETVMPRITKAQLEQQVADLQGENADLKRQVQDLQEDSENCAQQVVDLKQKNEDLKKRVRRGCDRSRSPRRPATTVEANQALTSRALRQVSRWGESAIVMNKGMRSSDCMQQWPRRMLRLPAFAEVKGL